jgi:hypothetical protein
LSAGKSVYLDDMHASAAAADAAIDDKDEDVYVQGACSKY